MAGDADNMEELRQRLRDTEQRLRDMEQLAQRQHDELIKKVSPLK